MTERYVDAIAAEKGSKHRHVLRRIAEIGSFTADGKNIRVMAPQTGIIPLHEGQEAYLEALRQIIEKIRGGVLRLRLADDKDALGRVDTYWTSNPIGRDSIIDTGQYSWEWIEAHAVALKQYAERNGELPFERKNVYATLAEHKEGVHLTITEHPNRDFEVYTDSINEYGDIVSHHPHINVGKAFVAKLREKGLLDPDKAFQFEAVYDKKKNILWILQCRLVGNKNIVVPFVNKTPLHVFPGDRDLYYQIEEENFFTRVVGVTPEEGIIVLIQQEYGQQTSRLDVSGRFALPILPSLKDQHLKDTPLQRDLAGMRGYLPVKEGCVGGAVIETTIGLGHGHFARIQALAREKAYASVLSGDSKIIDIWRLIRQHPFIRVFCDGRIFAWEPLDDEYDTREFSPHGGSIDSGSTLRWEDVLKRVRNL